MEAIIQPTGRPTSCHPLTVNHNLGNVLVGGVTLVQAQVKALETAAFTHTHLADGEDLNGEIAPQGDRRLVQVGDVWLSAVDLRRLRRGEVTTLVDADGSVLAHVNGVPEAQRVVATISSDSFVIRYPWDFLRLNDILVNSIESSVILGELSDRATVDGVLHLGEGSRVLPGVYIEGKVIIGKNCKIGPNCYLRGPIAIGDGCHVGQSVEIKASILMNHASVAHLSYLGDSIVGNRANFGAGTITANLRHDNSNNRSMVNGTLVDTGRRKLGIIVGDDAHLGINTSLYPGRKIWPKGVTVPGEAVTRDIVTDADGNRV